jgi:hypothetical protein
MPCGICSEKGHNVLTCKNAYAEPRREALALKKQFWKELEEVSKKWMDTWNIPEELANQIWGQVKPSGNYIRTKVKARYIKEQM